MRLEKQENGDWGPGYQECHRRSTMQPRLVEWYILDPELS